MDLKTANRELEKLDNEYNYWLKEKENLLSLVMPKASDVKEVVVDGGKREDKLLKYAELENEKEINATLDYIFKRQQNLMAWLERELKIMVKWGEVESAIIQIKETKRIFDPKTQKYRELTWDEIAKEVHWSKSFCRNIYRKYKKKRDI